MMNRLLDDCAVRFLDVVARLLPFGRREWGRAMQAESAAIDNLSERSRFALDCARVGLLLGVKAAAAWRPLAVAVVAASVVGAQIALAHVVGQTVPLALALAFLFWLGRRPGLFGPVRADRAARMARASGFLLMVLYLLVTAVGHGASGLFRPDPKVVPLAVLLLTLYAAVFMAMTARGSRFVGGGLGAGVVAGLVAGCATFVVMPFERDGSPLAASLPGHGRWLVLVAFGAPVAAAWSTGKRLRRADQAVMAALYGCVFAILLVSLLGLSAIALFPSRIPDIVGPVMTPGTTQAARLAANATEATDPYLGLLLLGGLLAAILWVISRPPKRAATRGVLVALLGLLPIALALSAQHFPGAKAIAAAVAMVVLAAVVVAARPKPTNAGTGLPDTPSS